jgi:ribonuclease BN (tRNA processing enzyme)
MRITVLGKSPAFQDAGGACSGYLVEVGATTLLLDCGPGVFAKLRTRIAYVDVDAVVISHLHADHVLDLVTFASALRYGPLKRDEPIRLIAPPDAKATFAKLCEGGSMSAQHIDGVFDLTVYDPAETIQLGEATVRFRPVPHYIPCNAVEIATSEARFTFSADCGPTDELVDFARDTDLLIIEATLDRPDDEGHLTPFQAGRHGAEANAKTLVLTHFSDTADPAAVRAEGDRGFGRPVELAAEGASYRLDD